MISFELPANARASLNDVSLSIYDLLGREIAVLVDDARPAGRYQVLWDASNFPTGMYICRLSADGVIFTRKLLLIR